MKMPTTMKEQQAVDAQNKTVMQGDRNNNNSPNPHIMVAPNKQDLNMTAPLNSE